MQKLVHSTVAENIQKSSPLCSHAVDYGCKVHAAV